MTDWDKVPKYLQEKIDEHIFKIEPKEKIMKNRTLSEKERELINYVFETYVQPMDKNNDGEQCNNYSWVDAKDMVFDIQEKLKQETSVVEDLQDIANHLDKMNDRVMDFKTFEEVVEPLMKWMAENQHPHTTTIVTSNRAELVEGIRCHLNDDFIVD